MRVLMSYRLAYYSPSQKKCKSQQIHYKSDKNNWVKVVSIKIFMIYIKEKLGIVRSYGNQIRFLENSTTNFIIVDKLNIQY